MEQELDLQAMAPDDLPSLMRGYSRDGSPLGGRTALEHLLLSAEELGKERHVGEDELVVDGHGVRVSTVFLVNATSFASDGRPMLWETMTFVDGTPSACVRATSEADAATNHGEALAAARAMPAV